MDPHLFRRHLRKLITNTAKATAIAGTALTMGCSITIIQPPNEAFNEGASEISREYLADSGPRPDASPEQQPDPRGNTPKPLTECPTTPSTSGCRNIPPPFKGVYHKLLTSSDPSPLSFKECVKLCQTDLYKVCRQSGPSGEELYVLIRKPENCTEFVDNQKRRQMRCEYEIRQTCAVAGRRPAGLEEQEISTHIPQTPEEEAGAFFAELAYLEDAAVTAFQYLVKELEAYDAPAPLLKLATNAIEEEREHVVLMTALAKRYGATPRRAKAAPFKLRPLAEIAIENAREGCVRESFGSLLGFWQSIASEDPAVRAVMGRIAHEESNHGALSWAIDAWLKPQLKPEDLDAYHEAHQLAIADIRKEIVDEPSPAMQKYAGFPTAAQAQHLFQQLTA